MIGTTNLPASAPVHASEMYARNLYNFLELSLKDGVLTLDWDDELIAKTCVTHAGEIKHEPTNAAGRSEIFRKGQAASCSIAAMAAAAVPQRTSAAMIDGFLALYIFMLAAFTGYEIIARVPVILHTPLMSGSNFVHGIVLVGAMVALGEADSPLAKSDRFHRCRARRRQCGRRLRRDRAHAGDVQVEQGRRTVTEA